MEYEGDSGREKNGRRAGETALDMCPPSAHVNRVAPTSQRQPTVSGVGGGEGDIRHMLGDDVREALITEGVGDG